MLFNSLQYLLFLPLVFILYWWACGRDYKKQNILLLFASYFFYACWDWRFLFLLIFSTLLDFYTGLKMSEANRTSIKRFWFWLSVTVNLGFLGIFKYYNFFADSFTHLLNHFGLKVNPGSIDVILPVGISFYTFHGLSYVIDIFRDKIKAEKNFIDYAVFVCYFPLLVAGPIERATHLLPQVQAPRHFRSDRAIDGLRQILWGLFKKMVIADNCATWANMIFNQSDHYSGATLVLGALFFTFQIYGDFSGYSDIALGTSRLFGIELLRNFAYPYFSRDIAEFWRRWHISLSSWFRDYVYFPLGGSRVGLWQKIRNTFIIFTLSGFWHGANWNFIVWGALNACFFLPLLLVQSNRQHLETVAAGRMWPSPREVLQILLTFGMTVLAWIFFRAESLTHALTYLQDLMVGLTALAQYKSALFLLVKKVGLFLPLMILFLLWMEWKGREQQHALARQLHHWPRTLRHAFYYLLILLIIGFGGSEQQFIYFQF